MSEISEKTIFLLALSSLAGVGPATLRKIINLKGFEQRSVEILAIENTAIARALAQPDAWKIAQEQAQKQLREAERFNADIISVLDARYPTLLARTKDDPLILFVKGNLAKNPDNSVAIIGTREPTTHGQRIARLITHFFAEQGWSVVSGLANGCDTIAHEATLELKGHTVAVLAHGLHMVSPVKNRGLAERILSSGGALVSEYPFGQAVQKQQFVKRDRTQAGLAQGVVMIQSDIVGGSLHASRAALDYHRWLAVPYPTERDRDQLEPKIQANLLIADGATSERIQLLRCNQESLHNVLILKSREDYSLMTAGISAIGSHTLSLEKSEKNLCIFLGEAESDTENSFDIASNDLLKIDNSLKIFDKLKSKSLLQISEDNIKLKSFFDELIGRSFEIATSLSRRLDYLQNRLENVQVILKGAISSKKLNDLQRACFAIDDLIGQMIHATELLIASGFILTEENIEIYDDLNFLSSHPTTENAQNISRKFIENCTNLILKLNNIQDSSATRSISAAYPHDIIWLDEVILTISSRCDEFNALVENMIFDLPRAGDDTEHKLPLAHTIPI